MRANLSPYAHELHYSEPRCADDCPACEWVKRKREIAPVKKKPPKPIAAAAMVTSAFHPAQTDQRA